MATDKTFFLETFGCQMNAHDSEKVVGTLEHEGYRRVETEDAADLILYNTCSIRDKAEQKVFNRLNDYKKLYKQGKRFAVLGCVAQQEGEKIFDRAPYVSIVSGSASYRQAAPDAGSARTGEKHVSPASTTARPTRPSRPSSPRAPTRIAATSPLSRAATSSVPTAWCRTPAARNAAAPPTSVLAEARRMADSGYTEIQLLGQNVNSYVDPEGKQSFAELLTSVGQVPGIRRVRFMTSHPRHFTRDIVQAIETYPTLCDHVHLPVQSGSSDVLRRMNREYTREQYLERISWIQSAKRPISLTTDIIVGFPGESESEFLSTLELLKNGRIRRCVRVQILAPTQHSGDFDGRYTASRPRNRRNGLRPSSFD